MPQILIGLVSAIVGAVLALVLSASIRRSILKGRRDEIIEKAEMEAEKIKNDKILQAKEKFLALKGEHDKWAAEKNGQIREAENRVKQKENTLNQQNAELARRIKENENIKSSLEAQKEALAKKTAESESLRQQANKQLETIAGMSAQEAKNVLMENMKAEARTEAAA